MSKKEVKFNRFNTPQNTEGQDCRQELKDAFRTGRIPLETDFEKLIDTSLNQNCDGIWKKKGQPLSIQAISQPGTQPLLHFYKAAQSDAPTWKLELTIQSTADRAGLNLTNGSGESRFFIDEETGYIGIGTQKPERILHIKGDGGESDDVIIDSCGEKNSGAIVFYKTNGTENAPLATKKEALIGLISFRGFSGNQSANRNDEMKRGAEIGVYAETDFDKEEYKGSIRFYTPGRNPENQKYEPLERMRIDEDGNVGIGTSTPNAPLQFSNDTTNRKIVLWQRGENNDYHFYGFGLNGKTLRYQVPTQGDSHVFYAGDGNVEGKELMRINGDGNVVIGGRDTQGVLAIKALKNTGNSGVSLEGGRGSGGRITFFQNYIKHDPNSGDTQEVNAEWSMKPVQRLVSTDTGTIWQPPSFALYFNDDKIGDFKVDGIYTPSDISLKKNIKYLKKQLTKVLKINPVEFTFQDQNNKKSLGLIAQEIEPLFPGIISKDIDPQKPGKISLSLDYSKIGVIAIQAIKEQQEIIERMKQEIDAIKKNDKLTANL